MISPPNAAPELGYTTQTSITLSWLSVSWALGYEIQVDTKQDFSAPLSFHQELSVDKRSVTITLPPGTYYWRVHARKSATEWGAWSQPDHFTIDYS